MRVLHPWRWAVSVLVVLLIAFGAYAGWLVWQLNKSLSSAAADAKSLRSAITAGDDAKIDGSLAALREHATRAADLSGSPVWTVLTKVPVFGDDATGVRVVSQVARDVSGSKIGDLAHQAGNLDSLLPKSGGVDLKAMEDLQQPVDEGYKTLQHAADRLSDQDPSGYVTRLRIQFRDLAGEVTSAADGLRAANTALQVMPAMLGKDGTKHYILVMQNNAEIRATGGLPGAVSLVQADHGRVAMTRQVEGSSFGERKSPVLPLDPAESAMFGNQIGTYFLDANATPDFARASDLWRARWLEVQGEDVDGVIAVDPIALSYLLEATGPVTVGGKKLTSDNVADELLHQVYIDLPNPNDQDAYFRAVAATIFTTFADGKGDPQKLASALRQAAGESRILVHSFDKGPQKQLDGTAVAGSLPMEKTEDPQVGVYFNDLTGAKMSYYLRYDTRVETSYCSGGVQGFAGHLTLTSTAPADAATSLPDYITGGGQYDVEPGNQLVGVQIYGPVEGQVSELENGGQPDPFQVDHVHGTRPVKQTFISLAPGETVDLTWTMKTGKGQRGDTTVSVTPSEKPGTESETVKSAC